MTLALPLNQSLQVQPQRPSQQRPDGDKMFYLASSLISIITTFLHLICLAKHVAILSFPHCCFFRLISWLLSIIVIKITAVICTVTAHRKTIYKFVVLEQHDILVAQ